jgi:hypothetical protein
MVQISCQLDNDYGLNSSVFLKIEVQGLQEEIHINRPIDFELLPGKRLKSLSAIHNSLTPWCLHKAAKRASWMRGPDTFPVRIIE